MLRGRYSLFARPVLSLVSTEMDRLQNVALKELSLAMIDILRGAGEGRMAVLVGSLGVQSGGESAVALANPSILR